LFHHLDRRCRITLQVHAITLFDQAHEFPYGKAVLGGNGDRLSGKFFGSLAVAQ